MNLAPIIIEWYHKVLRYFGFSAAGVGALMGAAWFFGLIPIVAAVVQTVSAIISPITTAVIQGVIWVWQNIFWPGIWSIITNLATIITVITIVYIIFFYTKLNDDVKYHNLQKSYNQCLLAAKASGKTVKNPTPQRVTRNPIGQPQTQQVPQAQPGLFDPILNLFK